MIPIRKVRIRRRHVHDADGNCTSKYVASDSGNTDITVYSWDNRDRLASVTHYATAADQTGVAYDYRVNYTYDVLNQLIKRDALTPNSGTTESVDYFIYQSGQVVLQFHENNPTGDLTAGDLVHRYLWDPQQVDQLLADEQVSSLSSPGQVVWPLLNDQNSVTDLAIYEAGITAIANHRVYNAYGNLSSWMGSVGCAFGYTGKYSDPLTRLQFNTNRWYDPATCRWMSQDPLGLAAGPNVYRYAGDNPVNYTDPSGLFVITTGGSGGDPSGGNPISIQGGSGSAGDQSGSNPITIQGATDGSSTLVEHMLPDGSTVPLPNNGHIFHFTDGRTTVDYGNGNQGYLVVQERSEPTYWSTFVLLLYENYAPFRQSCADIGNGVTNFVYHVDNLGIFALNAVMETVNDLAMMSNYRQAIFEKPIPYYEVPQWSRNLVTSEPEWVRQINTGGTEMLAGIFFGEVAGELGAAEGATTPVAAAPGGITQEGIAQI